VPFFDIGKEKGGLTITERGGGQQTKSLRLADKSGKEYTLRSIEKYAENALPGPVRETFAADLVQDQISASHPYGAFVVPYLADAANIYHTHPQVFYVPDDYRFGRYNGIFSNTLCLFEERPVGGGKDRDELGDANKVYSTDKMVKKLYEDNDNYIDQNFVLKNRLFDIFIGDWDRHDDQWKWGSYKHKDGSYYRPIPRDRDQVFFLNEGLLPKLASRKWILPKIQGFDHDIRDISGFNFNARYFDRSFLTNLSREDWIAMADTLKKQLTNEVIDGALKKWPGAIYQSSGPEIMSKLISRREKLREFAEKYYEVLANQVDILGSDKKEYFEVTRVDDEKTTVKVYKISKKGELERLMYNRTFFKNETDELRLYGLADADVFKITGNVGLGMKVRIIGGKGKDKIIDSSSVRGLGKKTKVYDKKDETTLITSAETKDLTSNNEGVNFYDRKAYKYNYIGPITSFGFNLDDGIFIGGGLLLKTQGFRKDAFGMMQRFSGNYALATQSYNFKYEGEISDVVRKFDLVLDLNVQEPNYVTNFFGLGNETDNFIESKKIDYYRVRYRQVTSRVLLKRDIADHASFYVGPTFQTFQAKKTPGRFIEDTLQNNLGPDAFLRKTYAGGVLGFVVDKRNSILMPSEGLLFNLEAGSFGGLDRKSGNYSQLSGSLSLYWSFKYPSRLVFATRVGAGVNFGDYEFFQAQTLGSNTNLRGYRRTRFSGKSNFYHNFEVRRKLFSFKSYLFPANVGLIAFHDVGRVWYEKETSGKWHQGYGGGIWLAPFEQILITGVYSFSEEGGLPLVKIGFLF